MLVAFLTLFLVPVVYVFIMRMVDRSAQRRLERRTRLLAEEGFEEVPIAPVGVTDGGGRELQPR